ncbi:MAG: DciA family protein [Alistipes senegalensis]|nr:DciA family protein [Oxalobacter formigenes]MCM1280594.1 DciA family protein [Alistipes senegalensis]
MKKQAHCAPVADFLQQHDRLAGMLPHAARLMAIGQACQAALPAWFSAVEILQLGKGRLTIGVTSQAAAARLRQKTPFLQTALQQAGWPVETIRIKVRLKNSPWQPVPAPKKPLSEGAISELDKLSSWLKEAGTNPALKEAVCAMLARHRQNRT